MAGKITAITLAVIASILFFLENHTVYSIHLLRHTKAIADVRGKAYGSVYFTHILGQSVQISGVIYNLTDGLHGFHIHEKGDVSSDCRRTGKDYNPTKSTHSSPFNPNRHLGDLGNIKSDFHICRISMSDFLLSLHGPNSIIGRAVTIHKNFDDLGNGAHGSTSEDGNAGPVVACGVIGKTDSRFNWLTSADNQVAVNRPSLCLLSIILFSSFV